MLWLLLQQPLCSCAFASIRFAEETTPDRPKGRDKFSHFWNLFTNQRKHQKIIPSGSSVNYAAEPVVTKKNGPGRQERIFSIMFSCFQTRQSAVHPAHIEDNSITLSVTGRNEQSAPEGRNEGSHNLKRTSSTDGVNESQGPINGANINEVRIRNVGPFLLEIKREIMSCAPETLTTLRCINEEWKDACDEAIFQLCQELILHSTEAHFSMFKKDADKAYVFYQTLAPIIAKHRKEFSRALSVNQPPRINARDETEVEGRHDAKYLKRAMMTLLSTLFRVSGKDADNDDFLIATNVLIRLKILTLKDVTSAARIQIEWDDDVFEERVLGQRNVLVDDVLRDSDLSHTGPLITNYLPRACGLGLFHLVSTIFATRHDPFNYFKDQISKGLKEAVNKNQHKIVAFIMSKMEKKTGWFYDSLAEKVLFTAIEKNHPNLVKIIMEKRSLLNVPQAQHVASFLKHFGCLEELLNAQKRVSDGVIELAIQRDCVETLDTIFKCNLLYDAVLVRRSKNVIHLAVKKESLTCLQYLLERFGYNQLRLSDEQGKIPLQLAVASGNVAIARLLLEHDNLRDVYAQGVDPSMVVPGISLTSPLHLAAREGDEEMTYLLLAELPDLCHARDSSHRTALHVAVENSQWGVLSLLLKACPLQVIRARDKNGNTLLHLAAIAKCAQAIDMIVKVQDQYFMGDEQNYAGQTFQDLFLKHGLPHSSAHGTFPSKTPIRLYGEPTRDDDDHVFYCE